MSWSLPLIAEQRHADLLAEADRRRLAEAGRQAKLAAVAAARDRASRLRPTTRPAPAR